MRGGGDFELYHDIFAIKSSIRRSRVGFMFSFHAESHAAAIVQSSCLACKKYIQFRIWFCCLHFMASLLRVFLQDDQVSASYRLEGAGGVQNPAKTGPLLSFRRREMCVGFRLEQS
jgi:hypothetical protein